MADAGTKAPSAAPNRKPAATRTAAGKTAAAKTAPRKPPPPRKPPAAAAKRNASSAVAKPAAAKPAAKPAAAKPVATKPVAAKPATGDRDRKPAKAAAKTEKEPKRKTRLVRDSFTMPETTYELFGAIKKRCLAKGLAVKKSEILRAAMAAFGKLGDAAIGKAIAELDPIRTGRPPKSAK